MIDQKTYNRKCVERFIGKPLALCLPTKMTSILFRLSLCLYLFKHGKYVCYNFFKKNTFQMTGKLFGQESVLPKSWFAGFKYGPMKHHIFYRTWLDWETSSSCGLSLHRGIITDIHSYFETHP